MKHYIDELQIAELFYLAAMHARRKRVQVVCVCHLLGREITSVQYRRVAENQVHRLLANFGLVDDDLRVCRNIMLHMRRMLRLRNSLANTKSKCRLRRSPHATVATC